MVDILAPLSKGLLELVGLLSIGLIMTVAFLDKDNKGEIPNTKITNLVKKFFLLWLFTLSGFILIQIAYLLDQPLTKSVDLTVIRSYLTQTSIGKSYLIQLILLLILITIPLRKILTSYAALS